MTTTLPLVSQLSSRVTRILGCNPGPLTLQGTNSYLIGFGLSRILLDTSHPDKPDYIANLKSVLNRTGANINSILITHWHIDHVGSVGDVLKMAKGLPSANAGHEVYAYKHPRADGKPELEPFADLPQIRPIKDGDVFQVDGSTLTAHYTPGHASDHLCFVLKEENALFSGDNVLGEGTTVVEDMYDYMQSLKRMRELSCDKIYPEHGPMLEDCSAAIEHYISHRLQREQQAIDSLQAHHSSSTKGVEVSTMVSDIYPELSENLVPAAAWNVYSHLRKLEKEGRVSCLLKDVDGRYDLSCWTLLESKL